MTLDNQYPPPAHNDASFNNHPPQSAMHPQQWPNIPLSQQHPHPPPSSSSSSSPIPEGVTNAMGPNFVPPIPAAAAAGEINGPMSSSGHQQQGDTITPEQQQQSLDPNKEYHAEWGVMRDQEFHQLALKHQRDLESHHSNGSSISDFYFWQANLGGYCMADMHQNIVVSSEGVFVLVRRMVEGAPHPGRKKKKHGMG